MILGIGTDLVETPEFEAALQTDGFTGRVFTEPEIAYAQAGDHPGERFAGLFAAKEATMKALGTGWTDEIDWKDIEIQHDQAGKPHIYSSGAVAHLVGSNRLHVSISHTTHLAIAEVIVEESVSSSTNGDAQRPKHLSDTMF
jgi:holo-[acyl-carrier protein] synthase